MSQVKICLPSWALPPEPLDWPGLLLLLQLHLSHCPDKYKVSTFPIRRRKQTRRTCVFLKKVKGICRLMAVVRLGLDFSGLPVVKAPSFAS